MTNKSQMWWIKSTYFIYGARSAFIARFLPLILLEEGLSDSQIGIVLSSAYFAICFIVPIISAFADLKNDKKSLFLIVAYFITATISCLYLLPYYWFNITDDDLIFYYSLVIMILYSVPAEFSVPILDALLLLIISNDKKKYGQIRSYTAMSWGLFHCIAGVLLEYKIIKLHHCLYLFALISIPLLITTYLSFYSINYEKHEQIHSNSISVMENNDVNMTETNIGFTDNINNEQNNTISDDYGSMEILKKTQKRRNYW
eukprot:112937_1